MNDITARQPESEATLSDEQASAMEAVAAELHRLNAAIRAAVNAGLSVELLRSERYHDGRGSWGDVMRPVVVRRLAQTRRLPQVTSSA